MLFAEPGFLFYFLPFVVGLHALFRGEARNILLLIASLLFYSWGEWDHLPFLFASVLVNHSLALSLEMPRLQKLRRLLLFLGVSINLGILLTFKYAAAILGWSNFHEVNPTLAALPLGISFYTFQGMAYLVDVYRQDCRAERRWWRTALFIAFFPQLIAGPILRFTLMAPQFERRKLRLSVFAQGMRIFIVGLGKKVLLADALARIAAEVLAIVDPSSDAELRATLLRSDVAWVGSLALYLSFYFDFSGYSDMAIGLGRMFGLRIPPNFRYPLIARSVTEFWQRWHISLGSWFRDYVYIPLGGNRSRSKLRVCANLWIVFMLCGIWHGASLTFLLFGAWFGFFMSIERLFPKVKGRVWGILPTNIIAMISIIFLSNVGLTAGLRLVAALTFRETEGFQFLNLDRLMTPSNTLVMALAFIASTPAPINLLRKGMKVGPKACLALSTLRDFFLIAILIQSALAVAAGSLQSFWYFRF